MVHWVIRPGERLLTAALAGYFFFVIAALYLMKPARNALFLQDLGASSLPYVYIATAAVTWWVVVVYIRFSHRATLKPIVLGTLAATLLSLIGFTVWFSSAPDSSTAAIVFYVWVKVYAVLLPSQFWLLSEEFLDPRQARRLFGPIGAGGIFGGIVGSAAAAAVAGLIGTGALLVAAVAALLCATALFYVVVSCAPSSEARDKLERPADSRLSKQRTAAREVGGDTADRAPEARRTLVITIVAILILATTAHTIVDWQFNATAEAQFSSLDARAAFFGVFFTVLNVVTLAIQMVATSFVLRYFGVGVAMALLPAAIAGGALGILVVPGLLATSIARGADDALRLSVDQSGRELLFLSFTSTDRQRLKPRIDLIASRAANGLGGVIILLAIWLLDDPVRYLSVVSLLVVALWAALVWRARRQYADTLKHLLRVRDLDVRGLARSRLDADATDAIRQGLASQDGDTVHAALGLAEHTDPADFVDALRQLLRDSHDADIKSRALHLLAEAGDRSALDEALANLDQPDRELSAEALAYACAAGEPQAHRRIDEVLAGNDPLLAVSAALCLLEHSDPEQNAIGVEILRTATHLDTPSSVEVRIATADIIRRLPNDGALRPLLADLLDDEAPQVAHAALAAAAGVGGAELVPAICRAGLRSGGRTAALQALQIMGRAAVGALTGLLADPRNHRHLRCFAAHALGRVGGKEAAPGLIAGLVADDRNVRKAALKALNYMRRRGQRLEIGHDGERAAIAIEWRDLLSLHRLAAALGEPGTNSPTSFVATVVGERLAEAEEQLFRALALRHPIQTVFFAYRGLITGDRDARAHAIELVDSIVETPERRTLVQLLDADSRRERGRIAADELGLIIPSTNAALRELLDPGDPWLAACALRAIDADPEGLDRGLRQELRAHAYGPLDELLGEGV